jgi:hypothetical protein
VPLTPVNPMTATPHGAQELVVDHGRLDSARAEEHHQYN